MRTFTPMRLLRPLLVAALIAMTTSYEPLPATTFVISGIFAAATDSYGEAIEGSVPLTATVSIWVGDADDPAVFHNVQALEALLPLNIESIVLVEVPGYSDWEFITTPTAPGYSSSPVYMHPRPSPIEAINA